MTKRVFVSYSHDSEEHKLWVLALATFLVENGVDIIIDQWGLDFGDDLPSFMEHGIAESDRVIVICTDNYIQKANKGAGGVGYEKTIATGELLRDSSARRKFLPVVRNVTGSEKLPKFFGAAYYLDLSEAKDSADSRAQLLKSLYQVMPSKPPLGSSPFVPDEPPEDLPVLKANDLSAGPSLKGRSSLEVFDDRFSLAFPGVRGLKWFDEEDVIADRLRILLQEPLRFQEGYFVAWWRGPRNLHIDRFSHLEGSHFLMGHDELSIRRIAAIHQGDYYKKFVYVEVAADEPTGLYPDTAASIARQIARYGFAEEEYGLVDGKLPVTREEYDDGAAIIDGKPVDIGRRVELRGRQLSPYNFIIAPFMAPLTERKFDGPLNTYLNDLLKGEDVFDAMLGAIAALPRRH